MSEQSSTPLARWRARMGLAQRPAAKALGISLSTYQDHEGGISRKTGKPIRTPLSLLLAAAAREAGIEPIE